MADGDIVRKITISATGENIDRTADSVKRLDEATAKASASNDNFKKKQDAAKTSLIDLAAGIYIAKTGYEALSYASDSASSSIGRSTTAIASAIGAVLMYLPHKVGEIWQQGIDRIDTYNALNIKAGSLSVEYYQQLTTAATKAKLPADEYLKVIENINKALDRKLGTDGLQNGSTFNTLANELQSNGNLKGLGGDISRLNNSVTGPEQLQNALTLITKTLDAGQKLAAFKLSDALGGPQFTENLKKDNDYIHQIQQNIAAVKDSEIIHQADVDRAAGMKTALDDAFKYLDSRNKKEVSDWGGLGVEIQQLWVNAVTQYAEVLKWLDRIFDRTADIARETGSIKPSMWTGVSDYFTAGMSKGDIQSQYGVTPLNNADRQMEMARQRLASQMQNQQNIARARQEAQRASDWGSPDNTIPPPKAINDSNDAVDRAINSVRKHVEAMRAQTEGIGQNVGALARLKVAADETAAVMANGGKETDDQRQKFAQLKEEADAVAIALEKAKVAENIKRDNQTAFLSKEDVQIANQLKGIYSDIPTALQSAEAQQMRFNNLLKDMNDTIRDSAKTFVTDLISGLRNGTSLMSSLGNAARNLSTALTNSAITDLFSGNFVSAGIKGIGAVISGIFGDDQAERDKEQQQRQAAEQARQQAIQAGQDRAASFTLDAQLAAINTNTVAGQIQAFDLQANKARADEMKAGGQAILELEKKLAADRQAIVDKANQQVIKSYKDFLASIKTGSLSTLSPEDQLKFAQSQFTSDVAAAKTGDTDAIDRVTKDAQSLLDIAKSFYASTTGYTTIYQSVTDAITGLANGGALFTAAPDTNIITQAPPSQDDLLHSAQLRMAIQAAVNPGAGYASGGIVLNGTRGVDSVTAKLAGGEFVTKTPSVNPSTLGALQYINRTGNVPKTDNTDVVRVLTQGFNGQTAVLADKLDALVDRIKRLEETTRQASTQRRVPGSTQKAA